LNWNREAQYSKGEMRKLYSLRKKKITNKPYAMHCKGRLKRKTGKRKKKSREKLFFKYKKNRE